MSVSNTTAVKNVIVRLETADRTTMGHFSIPKSMLPLHDNVVILPRGSWQRQMGFSGKPQSLLKTQLKFICMPDDGNTRVYKVAPQE